MNKRFVEVYAGAYASGKSETAINRARYFAEKGEKITLVDLDTVEPAYTLRPIEKELKALGINVITQPDSFGLGEAASYITPAQVNCLGNDGNIIIDVGYGAGGLDILNIVNNIQKENHLRAYIVINTSKFETSSVENIVEYISFAQGGSNYTFSGMISNTHFGDETSKEDVIRGYEMIKKVSTIVNLPIRAIGVDEKLDFDNTYDEIDVWKYHRLMPHAFW